MGIVSVVAYAWFLAAAAPPDPLAGIPMKDVCTDDALLLLRFPFAELRDGGFARHCCSGGALPEDDGRCELDWPWSDVPRCRDVDLLRNALFARHGYVFKDPRYRGHFGALPWYRPRADFSPEDMAPVARENAAFLKTYNGCIREEPAPPVATAAQCRAAARRYGGDVAARATPALGKKDRQKLVDAIQRACGTGWSAHAAQCLARGKDEPCLAALAEPQREALVQAMDGIRAGLSRQ